MKNILAYLIKKSFRMFTRGKKGKKKADGGEAGAEGADGDEEAGDVEMTDQKGKDE